MIPSVDSSRRFLSFKFSSLSVLHIQDVIRHSITCVRTIRQQLGDVQWWRCRTSICSQSELRTSATFRIFRPASPPRIVPNTRIGLDTYQSRSNCELYRQSIDYSSQRKRFTHSPPSPRSLNALRDIKKSITSFFSHHQITSTQSTPHPQIPHSLTNPLRTIIKEIRATRRTAIIQLERTWCKSHCQICHDWWFDYCWNSGDDFLCEDFDEEDGLGFGQGGVGRVGRVGRKSRGWV